MEAEEQLEEQTKGTIGFRGSDYYGFGASSYNAENIKFRIRSASTFAACSPLAVGAALIIITGSFLFPL